MNYMLAMQETPFGQNTRQNMRDMNTLAYGAGTTITGAFPRVGYLARVYYRFTGTITVTLGGGTATLDAAGPYNLIDRIRVLANSGQDIYSTTGYGNYLLNVASIGQQGYNPRDAGFITSYAHSANVFAAGVAGGANAWQFGGVIPIALNEQSEMGLILLQNEMAQTTLSMQFNQNVYSLSTSVAPIVVTGAATATATGTIYPMLETFSVPADPNARPDISWLHQILEFQQPIPSTGENTINLIRDNVYVDILHDVILNGVRNTNSIDRLRLVINQSDTPYDFQRNAALQLYRFQYHQDLPAGAFKFPLFYQGNPSFGDERDLVNGRATSELQSILTVATGTTLGSNANVNTITRQLIKLQAPPTRQA